MAYTLTGEKSGTVRFEETSTIGSESESRNSQVTSSPVEDGGEAQDHHINQPWQLSLTGVTVGGYEAYERLEQIQNNHERVEYQGRFRRSSLTITSLKRDARKDNADGCGFSVTLQEVMVGTTEYVKAGEMPLMSVQDAKKPKAADSSQTSKPQAEGRQTKNVTKLSDNAYVDYVESFSAKPAASAAPASRGNAAASGVN
ncbi:MAG: hypothetical protein LBJ11_09125 [Oscillospiraceae bacterium]|jgi:hypothetical protein|nr:hypothetical protein [Oscillospiraceae bacterium]